MINKEMIKPSSMGVKAVLGIGNFRLLWAAQIISEIGDAMTGIALLILVNRLTGSTAAIAGLTIVLIIPQVVFGLLSGVYVDRLNRKHIMIASDLLRGLLVLGLVTVNSADQIWLLYVLGFLQSAVGTFFLPAQASMMANVVPPQGLMAANSLTMTSKGVCMTVGSGITGLLTGLFGAVWLAFVIDALTFLIAILLVWAVSISGAITKPSSKATPKTIFKELGIGLKIVLTTRALLGTMVGAGISLLGLGAVNVLFVPMLVNELKSSESWLGAIQAAGMTGLILSGSMVALLATRVKPTHLISFGLMALGLSIGLMGLAGNVGHLIVIQFLVGCSPSAINASMATLNQRAVSDSLRGRVISARMTIASVCNLLSMAFAGIFGDLIGIRNVFFLAGALVITAGLTSGWIFRKLDVANMQPREAVTVG